MKTHVCNICSKPIDKTNPPASDDYRVAKLVVGEKAVTFTYTFRLVNYHSHVPDLDVCERCLLAAIVNPPPETAKA